MSAGSESARYVCFGGLPRRTETLGAAEASISASFIEVCASQEARELDIAIAACAINYNAALWRLNVSDFADIPGLQPNQKLHSTLVNPVWAWKFWLYPKR